MCGVELELTSLTRSPEAIAELDALLARAYQRGSVASRIRRVLDLEADGWTLARSRGALVGAGMAIGYRDGGLGWIGLVATDPAFERRGIGARVTVELVKRLEDAGCMVGLDASAAGAPLYPRLGFVSIGRTRVMAPERVAAAGQRDVRALRDEDLGALFALDRLAFGADRSALLRHLFAHPPGRVLVHVLEGRLGGFLVAQDASIGPFVAAHGDAIRALARHAMTLPFASVPRIAVPPSSGHHAVLEEVGFVEERTLTQMLKPLAGQAALPGRRALVAAQCSLGEG